LTARLCVVRRVADVWRAVEARAVPPGEPARPDEVERLGVLLPDRLGVLLPERPGVLLPERSGVLLPERSGVLLPERSGALLRERSGALLLGRYAEPPRERLVEPERAGLERRTEELCRERLLPALRPPPPRRLCASTIGISSTPTSTVNNTHASGTRIWYWIEGRPSGVITHLP
jgi:hypothetical protein